MLAASSPHYAVTNPQSCRWSLQCPSRLNRLVSPVARYPLAFPTHTHSPAVVRLTTANPLTFISYLTLLNIFRTHSRITSLLYNTFSASYSYSTVTRSFVQLCAVQLATYLAKKKKKKDHGSIFLKLALGYGYSRVFECQSPQWAFNFRLSCLTQSGLGNPAVETGVATATATAAASAANVRYKVWVVLGPERLELPTTYTGIKGGEEKRARKVLRRLRSPRGERADGIGRF